MFVFILQITIYIRWSSISFLVNFTWENHFKIAFFI